MYGGCGRGVEGETPAGSKGIEPPGWVLGGANETFPARTTLDILAVAVS